MDLSRVLQPMNEFVLLGRFMMTSSNGGIFRVTGSLCREFTGEFPSQRPVTGSFDVSFDLGLHKWLSKHLWPRWFEMPSRSLWCHCNVRSIPRIFIMKSMLWLDSWYHVALPRIKQSALHINVLMVALWPIQECSFPFFASGKMNACFMLFSVFDNTTNLKIYFKTCLPLKIDWLKSILWLPLISLFIWKNNETNYHRQKYVP